MLVQGGVSWFDLPVGSAPLQAGLAHNKLGVIWLRGQGEGSGRETAIAFVIAIVITSGRKTAAGAGRPPGGGAVGRPLGGER